MPPPDRASLTDGAPRWRTLAALAAVMLLLHLWVLGVDLPRLGSGASPSPSAPARLPLPVDAGAPPGTGFNPPSAVGSVEVTQVRWIVPQTSPPLPTPSDRVAPAPAPERVAQADKPKPAAVRAATAPAPRPLPPSEPPASTRLSYDIEGVIKGLNYRATSTFDWTLNAGRYAARTEMRLLLVGSRVQTSEGTVGVDGLRPERFSDKRRSEQATHFERDAARIRFSGNAPEAVLLPGAQDRLSLFMQLAGLLQARPHQTGDIIEFQVAGTGDAEPWRFEVLDLQDLDLPAGRVTARWVRRLPRKPHDTTVEMWLAPSLNHLPVRLRISQANGDVADQRLTRWP